MERSERVQEHPPVNRAQLITEREKAGAAYGKALASFRDAWARLAAVDRTLANGNVSGMESAPPTFHYMRLQLENALRSLQHHEFQPRILVGDWHDRAVKLSDAQIDGFTPD